MTPELTFENGRPRSQRAKCDHDWVRYTEPSEIFVCSECDDVKRPA